MTPNQLEKLVNTLLFEGYSHQYVQRLVGEIEDHRLCIEEEEVRGENLENKFNTPVACNSERSSKRLGTDNQILAAIHEHEELKSVFARYSLLTFAIIPSTLILVTTAFVIWGSNRIVEIVPADSYDKFRLLFGSISVAQFVIPVLLAGTTGVIARRCKVSVLFPMITTSLVGCCAIFQIDFGYCALSNSLVCYQRWEFDAMQLVSVWLALLVGMLVCNKTPKLEFRKNRHQLV